MCSRTSPAVRQMPVRGVPQRERAKERASKPLLIFAEENGNSVARRATKWRYRGGQKQMERRLRRHIDCSAFGGRLFRPWSAASAASLRIADLPIVDDEPASGASWNRARNSCKRKL